MRATFMDLRSMKVALMAHEPELSGVPGTMGWWTEEGGIAPMVSCGNTAASA
jgi:hypothetical protein